MNHDTKHMYELCKNHMHSYVLAQTTDGEQFDGIITGLDDEYVYFAVPLDSPESGEQDYGDMRAFGYPGYGYPGYGFPGYGYPPFGRPRRRFRRLVLPLAALAALSILPWY
ncbi:hypothetical protein [Oceanobacillus saliphilus]|uniref:hypothetical protein n=1 Tax=Oceanobacillus saliphilus TaxID=2925834 RepID=UPI00201E187F|nr:hypothetical protein [Oceanobacillus saliphilus]